MGRSDVSKYASGMMDEMNGIISTQDCESDSESEISCEIDIVLSLFEIEFYKVFFY